MRRFLPLLSVLGMASIAVSAFLVSLPLGFLATGVVSLVLEWRFESGGNNDMRPR